MRLPVSLALGLLGSCAAPADYRPLPRTSNLQQQTPRRTPRPAIQAQIGLVQWDESDLSFQEGSEMDPMLEAETDLSNMPVLGAYGQWPHWRHRLIDIGLEGGVLFSWDSDRTAISTGGGGTVIAIKNRMVLLDFSFGGYASTIIRDKFRLFAGAGPLLMAGWLTTESEDEDEFFDRTESDLSLGVYVRIGAEVRVRRNEFAGLTIRALSTEQSYSHAGDVQLDGIQLLFSYTVGL
jgi:hypothetical protein